jgi:hypothetical protein
MMKTIRKQNLVAAALRECSAGFQPAVSPTFSRQSVGETCVVENPLGVRIGNPRYGRLKVCATAAIRVLGALVCAVALSASAQNDERIGNEYRLTLFPYHKINEKLTGFGYLGYVNNPDKDYQTGYLGYGASYSLNKSVQLWGGLNPSYTDNIFRLNIKIALNKGIMQRVFDGGDADD